MGISQVDYVSSDVEAEDEHIVEEGAYELEGEGNVDQLMDVPDVTASPTIVAPYPTSKRQLRSSVVTAPQKMSSELRNLLSSHVSYLTYLPP
jgi:hypothetical protein